jgi:hypothetical protein
MRRHCFGDVLEFAGKDLCQKHPDEESAHRQTTNPHHGDATETNEHC